MDRETVLLIAALNCRGVGRTTVERAFRRLSTFDDAEAVLNALSYEKKNNTVTPDEFEKYIAAAEWSISAAQGSGVNVVSMADARYPKRFLLCDEPPVIVYTKGDIEKTAGTATVAVIGSRRPTEHGRTMAEHIGLELARLGICVVSGLAVGCDTGGHTGCLDGGGLTVAILPGDVVDIAPSCNAGLAARIEGSGGVLLSEYPPGTKPEPYTYVKRDRLQSALSDAVIVIETGLEDGTMHAVGYAEKWGKPIAAYSHPAKYLRAAKTQGNQWLIREKGATPISAKDDLKRFVSGLTNSAHRAGV